MSDINQTEDQHIKEVKQELKGLKKLINDKFPKFKQKEDRTSLWFLFKEKCVDNAVKYIFSGVLIVAVGYGVTYVVSNKIDSIASVPGEIYDSTAEKITTAKNFTGEKFSNGWCRIKLSCSVIDGKQVIEVEDAKLRSTESITKEDKQENIPISHKEENEVVK